MTKATKELDDLIKRYKATRQRLAAQRPDGPPRFMKVDLANPTLMELQDISEDIVQWVIKNRNTISDTTGK